MKVVKQHTGDRILSTMNLEENFHWITDTDKSETQYNSGGGGRN